MLDNQYLYKFAELAQTMNAVANAKNVSNGKGAVNMKLPIPKQEDTSKPKQIGLKKTLPTPTFKGILNPLPSTSSSLTKSASLFTTLDQTPNSSFPTYLDAKRFWKDKDTLPVRNEFANLANAIKTVNSGKHIPSNFLNQQIDKLYGENPSFLRNPFRYTGAMAASIPLGITSSVFKGGEQLVNRFRLKQMRNLLDKHPELYYTDTQYSSPTAVLQNYNKGNIINKVKNFHDLAYDKTTDSVTDAGLNLLGGKVLGKTFSKAKSAKNLFNLSSLKSIANNKLKALKTFFATLFGLATTSTTPDLLAEDKVTNWKLNQ